MFAQHDRLIVQHHKLDPNAGDEEMQQLTS
jgi:hypothetical protein